MLRLKSVLRALAPILALSAVSAGPADAANIIQSYVVATDVDLHHVASFNEYADGPGISNSYQLDAPGGVITDIFPKSSDNPPLFTYFLGTSDSGGILAAADAFSTAALIVGDSHLVLALEPGFAAGLVEAQSDFSEAFTGFNEGDLIAALTLLDTADLDPGDPGYSGQQTAKTNAYQLISDFSEEVYTLGGLTYADGGLLTLLDFSTANPVGSATALLTPTAGAVPEPATWAMMILGLGLIGVMLRRPGAALRDRRLPA